VKILSVRAALIALVLAVVVGACSDGASDEAVEETLARCEPVPQATVDLIASGLTIENGTLSNAAAVKSDSGPTLWIVAAQVNGDGFEGDQFLGTWGVVDGIEVDEVTAMTGTDDFTKGISSWGDDNDVFTNLADGVNTALACVEANQQG
jgi:serine protease inhibitor ecotin